MVMMLSEMEMPNNVVPHLSQYLFARKHKAGKSFAKCAILFYFALRICNDAHNTYIKL